MVLPFSPVIVNKYFHIFELGFIRYKMGILTPALPASELL